MPVFKELIQDIYIVINTDLVVSNSKANQTDPTGFGSGSSPFLFEMESVHFMDRIRLK